MTIAEENSSKAQPCAEGWPSRDGEHPPAVAATEVVSVGSNGQSSSGGEMAPSAAAATPEVAPAVTEASGPSSCATKIAGSTNPSGNGSISSSDATYISRSPPLMPAEIATAAPGQALVGQMLDHFELLELIGGGGMGLVFRARDTQLDRIVAIKTLSPERAADEETVRRFRNEAQSAARLDHEHIARVFHVGEARGLNYIVLEFIDGANLRDLVAAQGPLPIEQVLAYALQLAHALDHASSRNVVHRDIKPSNVLVTAGGRAKLVDMGLSRLQEADADKDLTASGVTLGTFDYISPEQARDPRSADIRSDIYSLGCTLYYLLTGRPPFPDGNAMQKLLQHQGNQPADLATLNPAVPAELSRVVRKMLAKDPRRRHQDARSLVMDLSMLSVELGIEFPSATVSLVLPSSTPWRRAADRLVPWLVPMAALVLAVALLDRLWASRSNEFESRADLLLGQHTGNAAEIAASPNSSPASPSSGSTAQTAKSAANGPGGPAETIDPQEGLVIGDDAGGAGPSNDPAASQLSADGRAGLKIAGKAELSPSQGGETSAGLAARDAVATPAALLPPVPSNVLVVDPFVPADSRQPHEFTSLKTALEKLDKTRSIIELRYTGRRIELPFRLAEMGNVTIRAADGHYPVLVFSPTSADETAYAPHMISLTGTQLTLVNVALELEPPPLTSRRGGWALVSLLRSGVDLEGCTLTAACITGEHKVTFFAAEGEAATGTMMSMEMSMADRSPARIQLRNCVVRGGASLIRATSSVQLDWSNGLAALAEPLLLSEGMTAARGTLFDLEIDHVTAQLGGGLCSLKWDGQMPDTEVRCKNSILICPDHPLIRYEGEDLASLRQRLNWFGDKNIYEGIRTYWRIASRQGPDELFPEDRWQQKWRTAETPITRNPALPISLSPPQGHLRDHVPRDYVLQGTSQAIAMADARDVGFRLEELPKPPPTYPARGPAPPETTPSEEEAQ